MKAGDFDALVPRPPGLTIAAIRSATDYIERELADLLDVALRGGKPGPANGGAPPQPSEAAR